MNKTQLIDVVATKTGLTKKAAEAAVNAVNEAITEALKAGDKVQIIGFGTYEVKERAAREVPHRCSRYTPAPPPREYPGSSPAW